MCANIQQQILKQAMPQQQYSELPHLVQKKADLVDDLNELTAFVTSMMKRVQSGQPERRIKRLVKLAEGVTRSAERYEQALAGAGQK